MRLPLAVIWARRAWFTCSSVMLPSSIMISPSIFRLSVIPSQPRRLAKEPLSFVRTRKGALAGSWCGASGYFSTVSFLVALKSPDDSL